MKKVSEIENVFFFNFYFLNMDILLTIQNLCMTFLTVIQNILNICLSLSYIFIA